MVGSVRTRFEFPYFVPSKEYPFEHF